jgi:long-chain fatty acid transport protein
MKKSVRRLASTAILAALVIPTTSYATNGYFGHAYSSKNSGLAGAGVALPMDAMASATNPAGMVWVGQVMDVGAAIFSPHRQYTVIGPGDTVTPPPANVPLFPGTVESDSNYFLIPHFGVNWMLDANSSVGVAIYGNGGMNTDYPNFTNPYCAGFGGGSGTFCSGATGVNLMQLFVNASYSRKINASSSWGVSVIAAYQQFEAKGLGAFGALGFSSDASSLTDNGTDSSTGFGVKIGWQGEVSPGLTLGASYQTKTSMGNFDKYKGLFAEQGGFDIPATATIGLAYKATPSSTVAFDIQQIYYSDVASIANPFNSPGFLGDSNGAGFGWEDMTVYKIGYQWSTGPDWTWRVGYSYGKQPIPNSEVLFNILAPGVVESHITFGFTNKLSPTSEWNFAAAYMPSKSVTGPNPLTTNQDVELKMYEYQVEASYSWKF